MKTISKLFVVLLFVILFIELFHSCEIKLNENQGENKMVRIIEEKKLKNLPNFSYFNKTDSFNSAVIFTERFVEDINEKTKDFIDQGSDILTQCSCEFVNSSLQIKIQNNSTWNSKEMILQLSDSIQVMQNYSDDIQSEIHIPQYVKLEISDLNPNKSDTIYGRILTIFDTIVKIENNGKHIDKKITDKYFGYFRCTVK